ncbi:MAG: methyltransferase domain-containing protein [Gammaproteobacteria bacterium]|nr:methyltransferase domain-containing protein [Gammaproteobacteria bacterium]
MDKDLAAQVPFQDISGWLDYWLRAPRIPEAEQAMLKRYYYSFLNHFGDYVRKHYASQVQEVEQFVRGSPGCRLLEVGCGCGTESLWLGLQGASVTGIDLNAERLATAMALSRAHQAGIWRESGCRVQADFHL